MDSLKNFFFIDGVERVPALRRPILEFPARDRLQYAAGLPAYRFLLPGVNILPFIAKISPLLRVDLS